MYLDNWLQKFPFKEDLADSVLVVLQVLADKVFIVNTDKSATTPTQRLDWLAI